MPTPDEAEVYIVARARGGWAVNQGADLLSHHATHHAALREAERLAEDARADGRTASVHDVGDGAD